MARTVSHHTAAPLPLAAELLAALEGVRRDTLALVAHLSDEELEGTHSPLQSPLVWDLAHIAAYEDLWLVYRDAGLELLRPDLAERYDAFETPRAVRGSVELLDAPAARTYLEAVRERVADAILGEGVGDGLLHELVLRHELQHTETMRQTMALAGLLPPGEPRLPALDGEDGWLEIPAGAFWMGAPPAPGSEGFAYDNERPRHLAQTGAFRIARRPVTNASWLRFAEGGGYERREWWSAEGWAWKEDHDLTHHHASVASGGAGGLQSPVCHVSWFEAAAFARAHDARLPTEAEWERAATWSQPALEGVGQVWEWTASPFRGYPGFVAYPYRGVLRSVLRRRVPSATWRLLGHQPARRRAHLPQLGPPPAAPDLRGPAAGAGLGGVMEPVRDPTRPADIQIDSHLGGAEERTLAEDVLDGLTRPFKELPPKHFYDARGAALFDRICELPEYYPTRTERGILHDTADELAALTGAVELVELGSGTAAKTRVLLDALHRAGTLERYVPVDVTEQMVRDCADELTLEYPGLRVHGVIGDFERHLDRVPPAAGPRLVVFLGGTIGNFPPGSRRRFLREIAGLLGPRDHLLMGTDLVKDPDVLEAAYDDPQGVTAEFNRNVLHVLNRELDADFEPHDFDHIALFDDRHEWIEMRLRARRAHTVTVRALELDVHFDAGEELRTEISAKFTPARLRGDLDAAGLELVRWLPDPEDLFALTLSRPRG